MSVQRERYGVGPDPMTPAQRSRAMKSVKLRDGPLEMSIRRALFQRGLRYRCHGTKLPGKPDIVFAKQRVAVFVDGDFWHGWRLPVWQHKLTAFWREKLCGNRVRDSRNFRRLRSRGWHVVRIWQHDVVRDLEKCIRRIECALRQRQTARASRRRLPRR
jgi:DNA mismatch endonuclease, patch repair protein